MAVFGLGRKIQANLTLDGLTGLLVWLFGRHGDGFLAKGLVRDSCSNGDLESNFGLLVLADSVVEFTAEF